jgi:hypothetical protein
MPHLIEKTFIFLYQKWVKPIEIPVIFLLLIVIALSKSTHLSACVRILTGEVEQFSFWIFFPFTAQWVVQAQKADTQ